MLLVTAWAVSLARLGDGAAASRRSRKADESDCLSHASITDQIWFQRSAISAEAISRSLRQSQILPGGDNLRHDHWRRH